MATTERLAEVRRKLVAAFSDGELRTLCFDLGVDPDSLPGQSRDDLGRELLAHLDRMGRTPDLIALCVKARPNIDWVRGREPIDEPVRGQHGIRGRSALQEKMKLVDALLDCASFRNRTTRNSIVEQLPHEIRISIEISDVSRVDAVNIVSRCKDFAGGIQALVEAVRSLEGDSMPMRKVDAIVRRR